jgi:uncharacterized protein YndB with AHSA1/START domain
VDTRTIKQTVRLAAPPGVVYEVLTDPQKHTEFTEADASGKPVVGGEFTAYDGYIKARYVELVKGEKIVQEWVTTEWPKGYPPSVLEIDLKPVEDGTLLAMLHSEVPASQTDEYASGWKEHYWAKLKAYLKKMQVRG